MGQSVGAREERQSTIQRRSKGARVKEVKGVQVGEVGRGYATTTTTHVARTQWETLTLADHFFKLWAKWALRMRPFLTQ